MATRATPRLRRGRPGEPAPPPAERPGIPSIVFGTLVFIGSEVMFFAALISAFLVLRAGAGGWPPPGQPRLPMGLTLANTLVLFASAWTMWRAQRAVRADDRHGLAQWLGVTVTLGAVFVLVQGTEWIRMLAFGLDATANLYGAVFYTVIATHGAHVLGGIALLLFVWWRARAGRYRATSHDGVDAAALFWYFVVGIWPLLFTLVYL
ncbi:MAG: heme-copper oxidase subunit III [bacterium]|nr:heme-copper oxidase subunit III [bacterium]